MIVFSYFNTPKTYKLGQPKLIIDLMPKQDVEEYLEAILDLVLEKNLARTTDLAQHLGVSPSSVTEMIQRLNKNNLIFTTLQRSYINKKGLSIANKIKRKHRIAEVFLSEYLYIAQRKFMMKHVGWSIVSLTKSLMLYAK